jgi:hypothetical protein
MHVYLTDPSAQQTPQTAVLGIPGADALYGCVDWFFYQPPQPEREIVSAEDSSPLNSTAELALI